MSVSYKKIILFLSFWGILSGAQVLCAADFSGSGSSSQLRPRSSDFEYPIEGLGDSGKYDLGGPPPSLDASHCVLGDSGVFPKKGGFERQSSLGRSGLSREDLVEVAERLSFLKKEDVEAFDELSIQELRELVSYGAFIGKRLDRNGLLRFCLWNEQASKIFGFKEGVVVGKIGTEIFGEKDPFKETDQGALLDHGVEQSATCQIGKRICEISSRSALGGQLVMNRLQDVTALHDLQKKHDDMKKMIRLGVWKMNTATKDMYCCANLRDLWGFSLNGPLHYDDFMGRINVEYRDSLNKILANMIAGVITDMEYQVGTEWFCTRAISQENFEGDFEIVGYTYNATAIKKIVDEKMIAEQVVKAKELVVSRVSHELKTPLNGILGTLEGLSIDSLEVDSDVREALHTVKNSGNYLRALINTLLGSASLKAGKGTLHEEDFNLSQLVLDVYACTKSLILPEVELVYVIDPQLKECLLYGDSMKLQQMIFNLVSNALKFTQKGQVSIRACLTEEKSEAVSGEDVVFVRFCVTDTGKGIAPERQAAVFKEFESEHDARFGGTGIGLPLVKQYAELLGGAVTLESEEGKGSSFYFTLPFKVYKEVTQKGAEEKTLTHEELRAQLRANRAGKQPVIGSVGQLPAKSGADGEQVNPLAGKRILIVDDNITNCKVAGMLLKQLGAQCDVVYDGKEAVKKVYGYGDDMFEKDEDGGFMLCADVPMSTGGQQVYDVILMDLDMPVMDGYQASRDIRRAFNEKQLPIIACTAGSGVVEGLKKTKDAGMNLLITKPLRKDDLCGAVLKALAVN